MGALPSAWRLLLDDAADGAANMTRDGALFAAAEAAAGGRVAPVLRIYAWRPWAVSLGNHQDPERALDLDALAERGWDWVRRPTGGRAVLHADEITYALIAPLAGPFADSLSATHRRIAGALARFYRSLGLEVALTRPAPAAELDPRSPAPCFAAPGLAELESGGRKLAGSAQRRGRHAFLQHGSLPLGPAHLDLAEVLPAPPERRPALRRTLSRAAVSLGELLAELPPRRELELALAAGFAAEFDIAWESPEGAGS